MKIWVDGKWYALPYSILVVFLEDKDKENIKNMHPGCELYCEYDDKEFDTAWVNGLLKELKKEARGE